MPPTDPPEIVETPEIEIVLPGPAGRRTCKFELRLTSGLLDRIKEETEVDLWPKDYGEQERSPLAVLTYEDALLGNVLWAAVRRQAELRDPPVTRDDFREALDGPALLAGWEALYHATIFFVHSRNAARGRAFQAAMTAELEMLAAGAERLAKTLASETTKAEIGKAVETMGTRLEKEIGSRLGSFASSSPP